MVRFRPNVAVLMTREDGRLLICERWQNPGAWQFPQGGVDAGESKRKAMQRELKEEIGLKPKHYEILESRDGYRYLYPKKVRKRKLRTHGCDGQEQTYFKCLLTADESHINVDRKHREFANFRWIQPHEFDLAWLPDFKRVVYREVMRDFFGVELTWPEAIAKNEAGWEADDEEE